eukprot:scpid89633/ scgid9413/ 
MEAKEIAHGLDIADRVEVMAQADAFVTLKDHKDRFANDLPCRLINTAKSELGRVSKAMLERLVSAVRVGTGVKLWKNTAAVIEWFRGIDRKHECTFRCFDVVEFYPSISEQLLEEALDLASRHTTVTDQERRVIRHARESLLFHDGKEWAKNRGDGLFDVTMGSYDGAEVCELVGVLVLDKLAEIIDRSGIGLYRDDGLAVLRNAFASFGLRVPIEANLKVVNYLDVTLNLQNGNYQPYRKPNDNPLYLNIQSNHPPNILRNLPKAVGRRIASISADEAVFDRFLTVYADDSDLSGFSCLFSLRRRKQTAIKHDGVAIERCTPSKLWFGFPRLSLSFCSAFCCCCWCCC